MCSSDLCRQLPLTEGPCADLGAGSGLLSRALLQHHPQLPQRPLLQLDLCPELLSHNPLASGGTGTAAGIVWDLNDGLPEGLRQAALLGYSALAITDRCSLAGVVRAHAAAKEVGLPILIGAEVAPDDAPAVVL